MYVTRNGCCYQVLYKVCDKLSSRCFHLRRNLILIYVTISVLMNYFCHCFWFCIFEEQFFIDCIFFIHQNAIKFSNQSGPLQKANLDSRTSDWTKWSGNFHFLTPKTGRHWPHTHSVVGNDIKCVRQKVGPPSIYRTKWWIFIKICKYYVCH